MDNTNVLLNVCEYGVLGDGTTNNTKSIAKVIEIAEKRGGGVIYFPPGQYVTGTIELKDNMTLYLDSGAVILGSVDPDDYPMITKETLKGYNREGHSGLIKAFKCENVTIKGRGVVDGRGMNWWNNPKNEHRPRAIQPILCNNVLIDGITIKNSAMWTVHPVCCNNVTINGITIKNPSDSPNTDGINPESCSNVHISNCTIDVGDDCLTLKSGTEDDELQKQYPCENIVVTNCTMLNGHGGVVIGSEMSGGVRNVTISNCVFSGTDRGIRIKTRRKRGGCIEDVIISNILMDKVLVPFVINGYYQCGGTDPDDMSLFNLEKNPVADDTPMMRNINISNIRAKNVTASAGYIYAIPEQPVEGLTLSNYSVEMIDSEGELKDKPIMAWHVQKTKGEGIFCANIKNSIFRDISVKIINGAGMELKNASDVRVYGLHIEGGAEKTRVCCSDNVQFND
ncbi:MAG: glycoside hydrolase family 28 protein [Clostridia bacterium]|nr:glycoside hydrolase family 28 protein [Clostridia bacterium]